MVNVKEAVKSATVFLHDMFPEAKSLQLEEVELAEDRPFWHVVMSFEQGTLTPFQNVIGTQNRVYKLVEVDYEGSPRKIKVWKQ